MALSRDAILAADDIKTEEVQVPEWGGTVFIKGMTGEERDEFEALNQRNGEPNFLNLRARLLVRVIVNETGTRIFTDQDAVALGKKSSGALNRLWDVVGELNGTSDKAQEETEGKSGTDGTADGSDSPSSSPETSA